MAEYSKAIQALVGVMGAAAAGNELEFRKMNRQIGVFKNVAAVTTNTAIAITTVCAARQKCRLVAAGIIADAAVTGTAGDYFTLLIAKYPASAPASPVNLITFAADTATTDNLVAYARKDLLAAATLATYVPTATSADFDLEEGDVLTCQVTKSTATGMTYPLSAVQLALEPRT